MLLKSVALAQPSQSLQLEALKNQNPVEKTQQIVTPEKSPTFSSEVSYQFVSYQSSDKVFYRSNADTSQSEFRFRLQSQPGASGGGFDIENTFQSIENANYFKPSEMYYKFDLNDGRQLHLGRRLMPWSKSDRLWGRGLFEPRFMDDPLAHRPAGLTGVFLSTPIVNQKQQLLVYASPLHIPELGTTSSVRDGQLTSTNPWFRPPSNSININDQTVELKYSIDRPDNEELVLNPSVGFSYAYYDEKTWGLRWSYAYKPMPQLLMTIPIVLSLSEVEEDIEVQAQIIPTVQYHHLSSVTIQRQLGSDLKIWGDWTYERPELESVDNKSISQTVSAAHLYTATLEFQRHSVQSRLAPKAWLSFSRLIGGDAEDRGEFATAGKSLFEKRFQYQQAYQLGGQMSLNQILGIPVLWSAQVIYDELQAGGVFSSSLQWFSARRFSMIASVDWIGLIREKSEATDGFTGLYRANDRFSFGVSYVF